MIQSGSNSLISSNGCLTYHLPPRPCYCALIISSLYLFRPINVIQSKISISKFFLFLFFSHPFQTYHVLFMTIEQRLEFGKKLEFNKNSDEGWGNVLRFIITSIHTRPDSPLRRALKTQKSQEPNNS